PDVPLRRRTRALRRDLPRPRPADGPDAAAAPLQAERRRVRDRDPRRGRHRRSSPSVSDPRRPGPGQGDRVHDSLRHGRLSRGAARVALRDGGGARGLLAPTPVEVDRLSENETVEPARLWMVIVWNDPINLMS